MRTTALFAATLLLCVACSSHKTTVATDQGTATVTTSNDNKTTTIESNKGTVTIGEGAVDVSKLGVPLYPNAKQDGSSVQVESNDGALATFTTSDSFEDVYRFYKAHMPAGSEKLKISSGDTSNAIFSVADAKTGEERTLQITSKQASSKARAQTEIIITHKAGK